MAPEGSPFRPLYNDRILFNGQPIALVVAEEPEIARFAASLVRVDYVAEAHVTDVFSQRDAGRRVDRKACSAPPKPRGSAETAFAAAAKCAHGRILRARRSITIRWSSTPRPSIWKGGGKLTIYDKTQGVQNVQRYVCGVFDMKPEDVRVMSPYVGGAFGSGLRPQYEVVLAVLAARALQRSVRVVLTRQQMYELGYRPAMIQRIELGAKPDGTLEAIAHEAITITSQYEDFIGKRPAGPVCSIHAPTPNMRISSRGSIFRRRATCAARARQPASMRSNARWTSSPSRSSSIRSNCVCAAIPIATRTRIGLTAARALRECYARARRRSAGTSAVREPRSMRDGSELVGWGMATGVWEALQMPIAVRIVLTANGHAEVACATSDIGTGTYTIMAQVAADMLGLPMENITIKLGDSTLPQSPVEGGSWIAASVSNGIVTTAHAIREELLRLANGCRIRRLPRVAPDDVALADGNIVRGRILRVPCRSWTRCGMAAWIVSSRKNRPIPSDDTRHAHNTHSAIFAEVKVDEQLGVIRVTRVVSAVAAGRILNTKTAQQPDHGRRGLGHRHGAARGNADRSQVRPHHERQHRRVSCAGERRHPRHRGDLRRRAGCDINPLGIKGAGRDRHRRRGGGDRQCGLSRDRKARARSADHPGQVAAMRAGLLRGDLEPPTPTSSSAGYRHVATRRTMISRTHQPGEAVFRSILPENIDWKPFRAFPPPVRPAVLVEDPTKAGPYVIKSRCRPA